MRRYLKGFMRDAVAAPAFKLTEALIDLLVPFITAKIINLGVAAGDANYIVSRSVLIIGLGAVGLMLSITAQYFASRAAVGYASSIRRALFERIQDYGYPEIDRLGASTLITRMTSDVNQVQSGLNLFLRLFLRSPFVVIGSFVMAFAISPRAAGIFAIAIPALAIVIFGVMRITAPMYARVQEKLEDVMSATRENLLGARVVRAFNKQKREISRFDKANDRYKALQTAAGRVSAMMNPLSYAIISVGIIAVLRTGAFQVNAGELMAGDVVALVSYMNQILIELVKLASLVVQVTRALSSLRRVRAALEEAPSMSYPDSGPQMGGDAPAIEFAGVSLVYPTAGGASLTDISFKAAPGTVLGVIGGTGSGKTSLVNLIPRFYDPSAGRVSLFGRDAREYTRDELTRKIAVVPQRAQLFSGSIKSNLLWGDEDATDEEIWAALEIAQAADFVRAKEHGLDDTVEEGGRNLSGGQRQRLTIARALLRKPKILILDDSLSALDYVTEARIRRALYKSRGQRTTVIISQRAASVAGADLIIALEDGRIAGLGRHAELARDCQVYREIYESQFMKGGAANADANA